MVDVFVQDSHCVDVVVVRFPILEAFFEPEARPVELPVFVDVGEQHGLCEAVELVEVVGPFDISKLFASELGYV